MAIVVNSFRWNYVEYLLEMHYFLIFIIYPLLFWFGCGVLAFLRGLFVTGNASQQLGWIPMGPLGLLIQFFWSA